LFRSSIYLDFYLDEHLLLVGILDVFESKEEQIFDILGEIRSCHGQILGRSPNANCACNDYNMECRGKFKKFSKCLKVGKIQHNSLRNYILGTTRWFHRLLLHWIGQHQLKCRRLLCHIHIFVYYFGPSHNYWAKCKTRI
jgi:hypothetical protein